MTSPTLFRDLPADWFPLVIEIFRGDLPLQGQEPLWRQEIPGPGMVQVPGLGPRIRVKVTLGDGDVVYHPPLPSD